MLLHNPWACGNYTGPVPSTIDENEGDDDIIRQSGSLVSIYAPFSNQGKGKSAFAMHFRDFQRWFAEVSVVLPETEDHFEFDGDARSSFEISLPSLEVTDSEQRRRARSAVKPQQTTVQFTDDG